MFEPTKHKMAISLDAKGLVPGMQGDGFASEPGGIMGGSCVALRTITTWLLM